MNTTVQAEASELNPANVSGTRVALKWALLLLPFAYLWFRLIDNLRLQWETDPQYSYGLIVPLLLIGLLIRRWHRFSKINLPAGELNNSKILLVLIVGLAFLFLPTRLVEEAVPEWRPLGWMLAVETIGLTVYAIYVVFGKAGLTRFAFPICFFFVAVPWPTLFEHPIIQGLSRLNAAMVVNVMGVIGIPAMQHGNVIEVSTGMVGINDACSGIRSIQSSLMISLFFGEFYFMNLTRRLLLIPLGFLLAMAFNLCRASFLTYLAAKDGVGAIAKYHDETGMTILFACTLTLWAVSFLVGRRSQNTPPVTKTENTSSHKEHPERRGRAIRILATSLAVWIIFSEVGIALWYSVCEAHLKPGPKWSLKLPEQNPTFKALPFTPEEHELLRFDDGQQGEWQEADGTVWRAFYFDWLPGRVAGYLAKRHTPDICLPATGMQMVSGPDLTMLNVKNIRLPMRSYVFDGPDGRLQVYQCHWEPGVNDESVANESSRFNLIRGVWAGRGNKGQKVIEIVISGYNNPATAEEALTRELEKLIQVEPSNLAAE